VRLEKSLIRQIQFYGVIGGSSVFLDFLLFTLIYRHRFSGLIPKPSATSVFVFLPPLYSSIADSFNSFVYVLRLPMIPSPWVYHGLNLLSIFPEEVHCLSLWLSLLLFLL